MKRLFATVLVLGSIIALNACTTMPSGRTVAGRPGSPVWFHSTTSEEKWAYIDGTCERYGYKKGSEKWQNVLNESWRT